VSLAPLAHASGVGVLAADTALSWHGLGLSLAVGVLLGAVVAMRVSAHRRREHAEPASAAGPRHDAMQTECDAPAAAEVDTACWTEWLDGWYWQTDCTHRLVQWRPPLQADAATWALTAELLGRQPAFTSLCHPTDQPRLAGQLQAGGRVDVRALCWAGEMGMPEGAGHLLGMPRVNARGECLGHHGVWQPQVERAPLPDVPAMPAVRAVERDELAEAAQEALRYALSHDLRAPLRVIDGFARIIKEDHAPSLDKLGRDHVERILAAAHRMNGMIDAVLDQAHLSQAPLQRAEVDLSALALDVAGELITCRPPRADGSLPPEVQLEVSEGMSTQADAVLVRRVFENLIGNAIKYSQKVAHPHITIGRVPSTDPEVYFVKDNGAGFDMKHADKLFGLFQRLHSTREFPGSGVGLASVNNIIRRHGGRVWAEAAPGEGACFYFSLAPFKGAVPRR
jgi:signal transduction histidine kinase